MIVIIHMIISLKRLEPATTERARCVRAVGSVGKLNPTVYTVIRPSERGCSWALIKVEMQPQLVYAFCYKIIATRSEAGLANEKIFGIEEVSME